MRNVHGTLPLRIWPSRALKNTNFVHERALVRLPLCCRKRHCLPSRSATAMFTRLIPPSAACPAQRKSMVRPTSLIVVTLASSPLREIEVRGTDGLHSCGAGATLPATTVVLCDAESFDGFGSLVVALTFAVSVTTPGEPVLTVTATVAVAFSG